MAVFHHAGQPLTLEQAAVPAPGPGQILVRNEYATLCRSDLNTYSGKRIEKSPTILGHEIVGVIEALGPGAPQEDARGAALRPGHRITWAIYAADPDSAMARSGLPQKAPDLFKYGHEQLTVDSTLHGGLAEYCLLRQHTPIVRIDKSLPAPVAALINCAVATVAGSLRLAGPVAGRNVLVMGAGMLGLTACAMVKISGAARVLVADIDESRLAAAECFGVDGAIPLKPGVLLKDAVRRLLENEVVSQALDYTGAPEAMEAMTDALGVGGTAVFVGATYPQRPLRLDAEKLVRNLHTIRGLHNYNERDLVAAVEFMEEFHATFPFAGLVRGGFTLDTVGEAFACGLDSGAHRVGVRLGGPEN